MNLTLAFIPYLNMVPFHQSFGPETLTDHDLTLRFERLSPRALGQAAESRRVDAGAMSLVDTFRLADAYEPLENFAIGVKRAAGSVLLFSKGPLPDLEGMISVTDETSTSFRLLQVLIEKKYGRSAVNYGRIASSLLFDGDAEGLLLIGDEALRARREGIKGFPIVTDLATEWYTWQGLPFVFAHWVARNELPVDVKKALSTYLENSLNKSVLNRSQLAIKYAAQAGLTPQALVDYWEGFVYRLTPDHHRSIEIFKGLVESVCLTA